MSSVLASPNNSAQPHPTSSHPTTPCAPTPSNTRGRLDLGLPVSQVVVGGGSGCGPDHALTHPATWYKLEKQCPEQCQPSAAPPASAESGPAILLQIGCSTTILPGFEPGRSGLNGSSLPPNQEQFQPGESTNAFTIRPQGQRPPPIKQKQT